MAKVQRLFVTTKTFLFKSQKKFDFVELNAVTLLRSYAVTFGVFHVGGWEGKREGNKECKFYPLYNYNKIIII